jgi:hypothetical protein
MPFHITLVGEGRRVTGKDQLSKLSDVSLDSGLGAVVGQKLMRSGFRLLKSVVVHATVTSVSLLSSSAFFGLMDA